MKLRQTWPALLACLAIVPAQAQSEGVGRLDQSAQKQLSVDLKSCAKPTWPKESLQREETGKVTLEFLVGLDGKVLESKVLKSSGFPLLDMAAQDGLAKCQFTPPSSIGRSVPTRTRMQYVWTLDSNGPTPEQMHADWQRNVAEAEQGNAESQARAGMGYLYGRPPSRKIRRKGYAGCVRQPSKGMHVAWWRWRRNYIPGRIPRAIHSRRWNGWKKPQPRVRITLNTSWPWP